MVEWASGAFERTFNQSVANGKKEPFLTRPVRRTTVR